MRTHTALSGFSLLVGLLTAGTAAAFLSEFGIEGMRVVSTAASEVRASISPDGSRIVWGTDREGGAGGRDLWQASLEQGRWQKSRPLPINTGGNDFAPMFSADGRWLYFSSNRDGGIGGDDLYRAAVRDDGGFGAVENLGAGVNSAGDEWAPTPSGDGRHLLFASDGHGGAGGHDLFVARWDGTAFVESRPLAGINTDADEFDAAWLGDGKAIVFARSADAESKPVQLQLAQCDGRRYADAAPLELSFNSADGRTHGPAVDWNKPGELLVSGSAKSPRAGKTDIYRMKAPAVTGRAGCVE